MPEPRSDGGSSGRVAAPSGATFDPGALRRRNRSTVAIDLLYLFATAFLATLFVRGFWPAVIAAVPLATLLYFAWKSTPAFFVAQLVTIVVTVAATYAGLVPI